MSLRQSLVQGACVRKGEEGRLVRNKEKRPTTIKWCIGIYRGQFCHSMQKEILTKKYLGDLPVVITGIQAGLEPGLSGFAPRALLDDVVAL